MRYKIEVSAPLSETRFRLQNDSTWTELPSDLSRNADGYARDIHGDNDKVVDWETARMYEGRRDTSSICLPRDIDKPLIAIKAFRTSVPENPSRGQLEKALHWGHGNDWYSIVLTPAAKFRVIDRYQAMHYDPVAVRHESMSGSDIRDLRGDDEERERVYLDMLDGWMVHLWMDGMRVYVDGETTLSEEELLDRIEEVRKVLS